MDCFDRPRGLPSVSEDCPIYLCVNTLKSRLFRFTLYSIIVHLIYTVLNPALAAPPPQDEIGAHFCGFTGLQPDSHLSDSFPNRRYSRTLANLDVGAPRTVRLIYFLPNDRPFRTSVVQRLKDDIPKIQTFYAQQMGGTRIRV